MARWFRMVADERAPLPQPNLGYKSLRRVKEWIGAAGQPRAPFRFSSRSGGTQPARLY